MVLSINEQYKAVLQRIAAAEKRYNRVPGSVKLLAVSKQQSHEKIQIAIACGQHAFGESYLQEALQKITFFMSASLEWHYIGSIQSNKTRAIAENFAWVHSLDDTTIATRLNRQRQGHGAPLNVCIQVNLDAEITKSGVQADNTHALAQFITTLPNLHLRGLMAIPAPTQDYEQQLQSFGQLQQLFMQLNQRGYALDTLSMGMSHDLEAAIAKGATLIRVGSAIFGAREKFN